MKHRLTPVLAALAIALSMMRAAHAEPRAVQPAPLSVTAAPDSPHKLPAGAYELAVTTSGDHAARVLVTARRPLKNFRIVAIAYVPGDDAADPAVRFTTTRVLHTLPMLSPDKPLYALVEMTGSIPNTGFSYTAEDGAQPVFALSEHGGDGSLFVFAIEGI